METVPGTGDVQVELALAEWRRKAVNTLMTAGAVAYLPAMPILWSGHMALTPAAKAIFVVSYLNFVAAAALRRVDYRVRLWTVFGVGYVMAVVGALALPAGPFTRAVPIVQAILLLALAGPRSGRLATAISAVVLLAVPFLARVPGLPGLFATGSVTPAAPLLVQLAIAVSMTALLVTAMLVVEYYHRFLMTALLAERQATASSDRRATELAEAHQALEREMNRRRRLELDLARAGDKERRLLGQELHDGVCQLLTGARLHCRSLWRRLDRGGELSAGDLATLSSLLEESVDEAHAVSEGLCPLAPDPDALAPALQALAQRAQAASGLKCSFSYSGNVQVADPTTAQHLYRIAQEALSNAAKHAKATELALRLCGSEVDLLLEVHDNGVGLPAKLPATGLGLRTMAYRAQLIDGQFRVEPEPGGGTCIVCLVRRPVPTTVLGESKGETNDG